MLHKYNDSFELPNLFLLLFYKNITLVETKSNYIYIPDIPAQQLNETYAFQITSAKSLSVCNPPNDCSKMEQGISESKELAKEIKSKEN